MKDWLDVFKTFDKYVELLISHPFVVKQYNEYRPIDIINSKIEEGEEKGFVLKGDIHYLNDCNDVTGWGIKKGIIGDDNTPDKEKIKKLKKCLTMFAS